MRVLTYSVSVCYCLLLLSHMNMKSFVRGKTLPAANYMQLSSDLLNVRHLLEEELRHNNIGEKPDHPQEVKNWPRKPIDKEIPMLGQVSGVTVKANGNPVIFHRGPIVWDELSFDPNHQYNHFSRGAIGVPTIVELDQKSGAVVKSWGEDMFYMPHSITVDSQGHFWVTDVALHQAFKVYATRPNKLAIVQIEEHTVKSERAVGKIRNGLMILMSPAYFMIPLMLEEGNSKPSKSFGVARQPGHDEQHLCQPTDVAVATTGHVFISDGYCNSRILKYDQQGKLVDTFGNAGELLIPHALTLLESRDMLCVADREHSRVFCYKAGLLGPEGGEPVLSIAHREMGPVYGVASHGGLIMAVTVPRETEFFASKESQDGFTMSADTGKILDSWGPNMGFETPHAVAVSPDGTAIYVAQIGQEKVWKFIT